MKKLICAFTVIVTMYACEVDPALPPGEDIFTEHIVFSKPSYFPDVVYNLKQNPVTTEGFALGRKLFYDPLLSKDNSISCGECHQQFAAFAHAEHDLSHGINGLIGKRNTPPLYNLAFHNSFMWDGGVNNLEVQPLLPISNPVEMGEDINHVVQKLSASASYRKMFDSAFGDDSVTSQRVLRALSQFMVMMISADSKYDKVRRGESSYTLEEQEGYNYFIQKCNACHTEPLFTDLKYHNNGLDLYPTDPGRAGITFNPADSGKVKVPSLRNLAYTNPYMHDGRFTTLDGVLDHYLLGIKQTANLDTLLTNGIAITPQERNNLLAFLKTLNDESFTKDKKFSEY